MLKTLIRPYAAYAKFKIQGNNKTIIEFGSRRI